MKYRKYLITGLLIMVIAATGCLNMDINHKLSRESNNITIKFSSDSPGVLNIGKNKLLEDKNFMSNWKYTEDEKSFSINQNLEMKRLKNIKFLSNAEFKKELKFPYYYYTYAFYSPEESNEEINGKKLDDLLLINYNIEVFGDVVETNGIKIGDSSVKFKVDLGKTKYYVTFKDLFIWSLLSSPDDIYSSNISEEIKNIAPTNEKSEKKNETNLKHEIELYNDNNIRRGYASTSKGIAVKYTLPEGYEYLNKIRLYGSRYGDLNKYFNIEIWNSDPYGNLATIYHDQYKYDKFFPTIYNSKDDIKFDWVDIEIPNVKVSKEFYVVFFSDSQAPPWKIKNNAPTGGIHIGTSDSHNKSSYVVAKNPNRILSWDFPTDRESADFMIRAVVNNKDNGPTIVQAPENNIVIEYYANSVDKLTKYISSNGPEYEYPKRGNTFLVINLKIINNDYKSIKIDVYQWNLKVSTKDNPNAYVEVDKIFQGKDDGIECKETVLENGGWAVCKIPFEVPINYENYKIYWNNKAKTDWKYKPPN